MTIWSDQKDDYIVYKLEEAAGKLRSNLNKQLCNNKYAILLDFTGIIPMGKDKFAKRSGDILITFNCPSKMGKIAPMKDMCMTKILLEGDLYMNLSDQITSKHESKVDCRPIFPSRYCQKMDGLQWRIQ